MVAIRAGSNNKLRFLTGRSGAAIILISFGFTMTCLVWAIFSFSAGSTHDTSSSSSLLLGQQEQLHQLRSPRALHHSRAAEHLSRGGAKVFGSRLSAALLRHKQALSPSLLPSASGFQSLDCLAHMDKVQAGKPGDPLRDFNKGQLFARRTIGKYPFWISLHNQSFDTARWPILRDGFYYETILTDVFAEILTQTSKDELVVDVGGNIGWFTLLSAALGHDVHVFEPMPLNQFRLCQSLILNRWMEDKEEIEEHEGRFHPRTRPLVRLYPYGVGAEPGVLPLVGAAPGSGTFVDAEARYSTARGKWANISIVTLDRMATEFHWMSPDGSGSGRNGSPPPRVAILKMDVEGYEPEAMRGAHKLLRTGIVRNILMEITNMGNETSLINMLADIGQAGFELHKVGLAGGPSDRPKPQTLSTNMREQAKRIVNTWVKGKGKQANLWWRYAK